MSDFPAVDVNESATQTLQDCDAFFKEGVEETVSNTYDYASLEAKLDYLPGKQRALYLSTYQIGRYGEYAGWGSGIKAQWPNEAGRATALGMDDALAGRPAASRYAPLGTWAVQDVDVLNTQYQRAYAWGQALLPSTSLNMGTAVLAGLVFAAAVATTVYVSTRKSSTVLPLEQERYANPSKKMGVVLYGGGKETRDVLFEYGLLAVTRDVAERPSHPKGWERYDVVETLTGKTLSVKSFKYLSDAKEFAREFGDKRLLLDSLVEAMDGPGPITRELNELVLDWQGLYPVENPSRSPGMTVQPLLFNREAWDLGPAKRWAKNHNYRTDDVDVKPNTIRMRQADPKHFQKKTMRTIQFGDDSGIQAVVARPKR